ncbi:hypothetical protein JW968_01580 [Candidatus Woesearchaeota archaeon]|nr:hypothetical protein [Candidatus Woesearchaeota archaeon]
MKEFQELLDVVEKLHGPDGCEWDKRQTLESFYPFILEEAEEVVEAIGKEDPEAMKEELGDLLWNILFACKLAQKQDLFSIEDVLIASRDKMIRRHPHVFSDEKTKDIDKIKERWQEIKKEEKWKRKN